MTSPHRDGETALGALVREHRWAQSRALVRAGIAALLFAALCVAAVRQVSAEPTDELTPVFAAMFIGLPIAIALWFFVLAFRLRGNVVRVHERGLVHRWSGVETIVRYEDVVEISGGVPLARRSRQPTRDEQYVVHLAQGVTLNITYGFEAYDELAEDLRRRVARAKAQPSPPATS